MACNNVNSSPQNNHIWSPWWQLSNLGELMFGFQHDFQMDKCPSQTSSTTAALLAVSLCRPSDAQDWAAEVVMDLPDGLEWLGRRRNSSIIPHSNLSSLSRLFLLYLYTSTFFMYWLSTTLPTPDHLFHQHYFFFLPSLHSLSDLPYWWKAF